MNHSQPAETGSHSIKRADEPAPADYIERLAAPFQPGCDWLETFAGNAQAVLKLVPCSGAAMAIHGDIRCANEEHLTVAKAILEDLPKHSGHHLYYSNQWRPAGVTPTTARCQAVLAIRFNPAEAGWLIWFHVEGAGDTRQTWSHDDIALAERVRTQLMERCLESVFHNLSAQHQLISALGHNLLNPLQAISMSSLLLRQASERNLDLRKHIAASSSKMEALIKHALDINRVQVGDTVSLSPGRADVSRLVEAAINEIGVEMLVEDDFEQELEAFIDPDRYRQAISTLLHFAASQQQPGTPLYAALKVSDDLLLFTLTLSVADAADTARQANALMRRPDLSTLDSFGNSGNGTCLFIANAIAAAHGGTMAFASRADRLVIEFTVASLP